MNGNSIKNRTVRIGSWINCDYYRYLAGDKDAADKFNGEYMPQYSWAVDTEGSLTFD